MDATWQTWRSAASAALYGPGGFFRTQAPADHFRTSVHVSEAFATALLRLVRAARLDTVVDIGAGRGELLAALHRLAPDLRLVAVELADRPSALPAAVIWTADLPSHLDGLVLANEWLDDVPADVAEVDGAGTVRLVEVDAVNGTERLGPPATRRDLGWLDTWWPLRGTPPGTRAEIGWPRDESWADVVRRLGRGIALAMDYGHLRAERPGTGTLTAYRSGRCVTAVPDGSCDITCHVAVDAVAAAGEQAGADATLLTRQRSALRALDVDTERPPLALAETDPAGYLRRLAGAGEAAELVATGGLGDFWWLLQTKRTELPAAFAGLLD
jgi:SAM-dependent MidA family methyltransferase